MAKYDCEVKDAKGDILKTQLEAPNMQELAARLSDKGFYLVKATEIILRKRKTIAYQIKFIIAVE